MLQPGPSPSGSEFSHIKISISGAEMAECKGLKNGPGLIGGRDGRYLERSRVGKQLI